MSASDSEIRGCPPPDANPEPPRFAVPSGACDCHAHLFGPQWRYPYSPARGYTPPQASLAELNRVHRILGIEHCVLTQPSVYGTDNRCMMNAIAAAPEKFRAVIAIDDGVTDEELECFHRAGARGVRINIVDKGGMPFETMGAVARFAARLAPFGWHVEVLIHVDEVPDLKQMLSAIPVDVVVGHLGYLSSTARLDTPGFQDFLALLRDGNCWAKMTGAYRITAADTPPYADVIPIAQAIINAAPDRVIWGSDWPHPSFYRTMPNDGYLLDQVADWTSDPVLIHKILVENPQKLYGF